MNCRYLIVSSITYAMKAKGELEKHGIFSKIEKIKKNESLTGCGFGLKVSYDKADIAAKYINLSGIKVFDIIDCEAKSR